jgi:ATP-dependent DNA ligase
VPVGKAYSGYTDQELVWLDRWIRNHTVSRFGPVREVDKSLVLEVVFDAAQLSNRHKSGVALRFPRILRIRKDKPASEADRLENLMNLVEKGAAAEPAG